MVFDTWVSQALGRPPTMWSVHCDVQMPDDVPEFKDIRGNPEMSCKCGFFLKLLSRFGWADIYIFSLF